MGNACYVKFCDLLLWMNARVGTHCPFTAPKFRTVSAQWMGSEWACRWQMSAQINWIFQHYTVHDWRSRQWTMIAIFVGTEEPKSTISRWVLLVYEIILIVYWNVTTNVWLHAVHCANHRRNSGVGYPDEFTSWVQCTTLYSHTRPVRNEITVCTTEAHQLLLMK